MHAFMDFCNLCLPPQRSAQKKNLKEWSAMMILKTIYQANYWFYFWKSAILIFFQGLVLRMERSCSQPQIHMFKPLSQCDDVWRWGLWEVIRIRWGSWRWGPHNETSTLIRDTRNLALSAMSEHSKKVAICNLGREYLPETKFTGTLSWTSSIQYWENEFLLFQASPWYFVIVAQAD